MSYQEERYWTDYLRIALPIAGLLLLLGVFWYWANSFIGDDGDTDTTTPVVAVQTTPLTAPTPTPENNEAVQIQVTVQSVQPTVPAVATTDTSAAEPSPTPDAGGDTTTSGTFAEGDTVIVTDNDVNMRDAASTTGNIVDTLPEGTELTIVSATSEEADGYVWWNVEDPLNATTGWVVEDFIETP